jgi:hypothetical protein
MAAKKTVPNYQDEGYIVKIKKKDKTNGANCCPYLQMHACLMEINANFTINRLWCSKSRSSSLVEGKLASFSFALQTPHFTCKMREKRSNSGFISGPVCVLRHFRL